MRHRPLLVWAAAFAAGIGLGALGCLPLALAFGLAALGLVGLTFGRRPAVLVLGLAALGLSAGGIRLAAFQTVSHTDVSRWADRPAPVTLLGTVISDPDARRGGRLTLLLRAEQVRAGRRTYAVSGDVWVALGPQVAPKPPDYGDRVEAEGTLETPRGATNPGAFSWRDYLARRGVYCQLRVKRPGGLSVQGASRLNPFLRLAWGVRRHILTAVHVSLGPTEAAVLSGILLGHRTELAPDLMADFVHTGTVHILASAGLHVGIVAFWLEALCRRLTLPRKLSALLIILTLWLYALMAGGRPSVTRAVVMATLYFGAILFEREPDLPTTVGAAALLILLLQPTALLEPGFQLSFLTILTLAVTMPVWDGFWRPKVERRVSQPRIRKVVLWTVEMAGLSLLAQIGSLPVVATSYNEFSLSGWLANALVVPCLFVLIPVGFLGAGLWGLWHAAGASLLALTGWGIDGIVRVVRGLGEASWAYRALPSPPPLAVWGFYALVYGGTDAIRRRYHISAQTLAAGPAAAGPPAGGRTTPVVGVGPAI